MPTEAPPALKKSQLLSLYRQMLLIRCCEERLARSHQPGYRGTHGDGKSFVAVAGWCTIAS